MNLNNPIQNGGAGGAKKLSTSFAPVTSANVGGQTLIKLSL